MQISAEATRYGVQAVGQLGLAVASIQPLGAAPWTYALSYYSVQVG